MAEYIEREALLKEVGMANIPFMEAKWYKKHFFDKVVTASAADVAPVVHGRWRQMDGEDVGEEWYCTACNQERHFLYEMDLQTMVDCYHYCPNCGAKMDLKGE